MSEKKKNEELLSDVLQSFIYTLRLSLLWGFGVLFVGLGFAFSSSQTFLWFNFWGLLALYFWIKEVLIDKLQDKEPN